MALHGSRCNFGTSSRQQTTFQNFYDAVDELLGHLNFGTFILEHLQGSRRLFRSYTRLQMDVWAIYEELDELLGPLLAVDDFLGHVQGRTCNFWTSTKQQPAFQNIYLEVYKLSRTHTRQQITFWDNCCPVQMTISAICSIYQAVEVLWGHLLGSRRLYIAVDVILRHLQGSRRLFRTYTRQQMNF